MRSLGKYDVAAIAIGGVLGAVVRWLVARPAPTDDLWFTYAANDSVTAEADAARFLEELDETFLVSSSGIPFDTLAVNLAGCLLLGAFTWLLARSAAIPRRLLLAAATGFCGSLTTFSAFAVELAARLRGQPVVTDEFAVSMLSGRSAASTAGYLALSVLGGALAFWLGRAGTNTLSGQT